MNDADLTRWDRHEQRFLEILDGCLDLSDFTEYSSRRQSADTKVISHSRIYQGAKLDRVMINRYSLRPGRSGLVIFGYPRVEYPIPCFLLHIGGMIPTKTLLILDLAPSSPMMDMTAFVEVVRAHRAALELPAVGVEWLSDVTSPYLLYCPMKPLDPEKFLEAFAAIVQCWRHSYIDRAIPETDAACISVRRATVLEMKTVVFRNDPAFPVFARAFGKTMSDVFAEAGFGGNPGVDIKEAIETLPTPGSWVNKKLSINWNADAQERVHEAPAFLRPVIRRMIEKEAARDGHTCVDVEFVMHCERKYRGGVDG